MATQSDNKEYLNLDDVRLSYRQKDNTIHLFSTDPDVKHGRFYMMLDRNTPIEETARGLLESKGMIGKNANPNDIKYEHDIIKDFLFDVLTKKEPYHLRVAGSSPSGKTIFHSTLIENSARTNALIQHVGDSSIIDYKEFQKNAEIEPVDKLKGKLDPFTLFSSKNRKVLELAYALTEALFQVDSVYTPKYEKEAFDNALKRMNASEEHSFASFIRELEKDDTPEGKFHLEYVSHLKTLYGWNMLYSDGTSLPHYHHGLVQWEDTTTSLSSVTLPQSGIILWESIFESKRGDITEYVISLMLLLHSLRAILERTTLDQELILILDAKIYASIEDRLAKEVFSVLLEAAKDKQVYVVFTSDIKKQSEAFSEGDIDFKLISFRQFDFDYRERYDWKEVLSDLKLGEYSTVDSKGIINIGMINPSEKLRKAIEENGQF